MHDRGKVIEALDCCTTSEDCLHCPYDEYHGQGCFQMLMDDALALLKEQEPVEARKKSDGKPQPWTCWWYVCGDCGQEIEFHDRFCRWCGRSVKWDA